MKILLATYWYVPHLGGVWSVMLQLGEKLRSLGHEVDYLGYGDEAGSFVYIVNKNQRIQTNKLLPMLQTMLNESLYPAIHKNALVKYTEFRRYAYELAVAYLGLESYDVIHTQDVISTACINRIRPARTALVATLHGCVAHDIRLQLKTIHKSPTSQLAREYFDRLEHTGASSAEVTIVANDWMRKNLTDDFHVDENKIKKYHYGYDIHTFLQRMAEKPTMKRPEGKKVILYAGRIVQLKGLDVLIEALGKLKKKRDKWVCWIIGEGNRKTDLRIQAKLLGLQDDVVFMDKRDDIPSLLTQVDIFVQPSLIENQSLAVIEAQLAAKAIIASDAGGLPEMIKDGVTGLLVPVGNADKLYRGLERLLSDRLLRNKLGDNAKHWAMSHWSLDKLTNNIIGTYKSAIEERRSNANA
ncbi:glycosyltransferase family 4 protein [Cohnella terricola]|uniref:Glycosyltransferase family 4 protein n=1 Tax=Cohnella terricola TaxID=1289167 RepID=A0A559JQL7_9BACL|nr:glycosyltransferase family 4 protein [Cohnella terricola]TVY02158.1 glycosyltransferase family 4 protein [Cohnella terricola]